MKKFLTGAVLLLLLFSCGINNDKAAVNLETITDLKKEVNHQDFFNPDTIINPQPSVTRQVQQTGTPSPKEDWDKKIIKTAVMNLEVKDFKDYNTSLRARAKEFGGYIAKEEQVQSEYKIENTISIKVPVDQFDDAVTAFTGDAKDVLQKTVTSQDVTMEVIDTRSRLESKKEARLRYLDFMKNAKNMQEVLNVQSQVNEIQEQIEAAAGRIQYLSHAAVFSTINITYFQVLNVSAKDPAKISFGTKMVAAFKDGLSWVGDILIGLINIWPLFLVGIFTWVMLRKWRAGRPQKANINEA